MARKRSVPSERGTESDLPADTPEYLRTWAKELVKTAGKAEARSALAEYQRLAADRRVPAAERKAAAKRAEALEKNL